MILASFLSVFDILDILLRIALILTSGPVSFFLLWVSDDDSQQVLHACINPFYLAQCTQNLQTCCDASDIADKTPQYIICELLLNPEYMYECYK